METLSSSVSTLKVPILQQPAPPRQIHHLKTPSSSQQLPPNPHFTSRPKSISTKTTLQPSSLKTAKTSLLNSTPNTHRNPATGYAAALLDIAQSNNSLPTLHKDVQRFSKLLQHEEIRSILMNPFVGEKGKGLVIKEVGKEGKFSKLLLRLLNMLIERNKVMMVSEVLAEFQRIFDELIGTKVALVSSVL